MFDDAIIKISKNRDIKISLDKLDEFRSFWKCSSLSFNSILTMISSMSIKSIIFIQNILELIIKTSLYTIKRILRAFLVLNLFVIDINIENINNRRNLFNENDYDRSEGLNRFPFLYDGQRASTLLVVRASLVSIFFTEFQRTPSKMKIIKNNWFVDCSNWRITKQLKLTLNQN